MKRFLLLCLTTLLASATWAQEFSATTDGVTLLYNIVDSDDYDYACEVAYDDYWEYDEIYVPSTVTNEEDQHTYTVIGIGEGAFSDSEISSIKLPDTITYIAGAAFSMTTRLTSITLPKNLKTIGMYAFGESELTSIELPEGLYSLGSQAFTNCSSLTKVVLPATLTEMGQEAFYYCRQLSDLTIPSGITTLGSSAFSYCTSLTSVFIPAGITNYGEGVFTRCTSLVDVTFGESFTTLGDMMFDHCTALTTIDLPSTLTKLGDSTFQYTGITQLKLPSSLTQIDAWAFSHMESLNTIEIPNTITSIGASAFRYTYALTSLELPSSLTSMSGSYTFASSGIQTLTLPEKLESIGQYAFQGSSLKSISIPESVISMGTYTFQNCKSLTEVEYHASLSTIPNYMCDGCSVLATVDIAKNVENIGQNAFSNCSSLTSFSSHNPEPPICGSNVFSGVSTDECTLYVPKESGELYSAVEPWKDFIIEETDEEGDGGEDDGKFVYEGIYYQVVGEEGALTCEVTYQNTTFNTYSGSVFVPAKATYKDVEYNVIGIGANAFRESEGLTDVSFAESITYFDEYAFYNCGALTEFTIPSTITMIGEQAIGSCAKLTSITIADSEATLSANSTSFDSPILSAYVGRNLSGTPFYENATIESVTFGENISSLPNYSFNECTALRSVTIPGNIKEIGDYAFLYCSGLETVVLSEGVNYLGTSAFQGCSSLKNLTFPKNSLETIKTMCFEQCTALEEVTFPASVTSLSGYTFDECTNLKKFTFVEGCTYISYLMFCKCSALTDVIIPNSVTTIDRNAFEDCISLENISTLEGVETIGQYAFHNCTSLKNITFYDALESIANYAFMSSGLAEVYIPSIREIGNLAFGECNSLQRVVILEQTEACGTAAFSYNSALQEIVLGEVFDVASNEFADCPELARIYCLSETPPIVRSNNSFLTLGKNIFEQSTLYIPEGTYDDYSTSYQWEEWKTYNNIIEMTKFAIATLEATDITDTTATLNGSITAAFNDPITERGFEYWTGDEDVQTVAVDMDEDGEISLELTELAYGTDYTYRAYAITESGDTNYGEELTFTTELYAPAIVTLEASDVAETSAVLNGTVEQGSEPITRKGFVYWSSDPNVVEVIIISDEDMEMSYTLSSLTPETTYTYRAFAVTDSGTTYGEDVEFTTLEDTTTGINGFHISIDDENVEGIYSTSGQKLNSTVKGVNIVRYVDGSVKKIYVK